MTEEQRRQLERITILAENLLACDGFKGGHDQAYGPTVNAIRDAAFAVLEPA